ncbi:hypothetical protein Tco_1326162 [Tanacetum coccineum]
MPYLRFTKIIINYFLKQPKSLTNLNHKHLHTIKDDVIVCRLMFIRIGEDYHEYGHVIPNVMLTDTIKRSESYQMFLKYFSHQIPPKKSRGKGSQGKKIADTPVEEIELAKSAEAARKVHDTHARIVTESVSESAKKKSSGRCAKSVVIQETLSTPKSKPATSKAKLKGFPSLTLEEQEPADIIQAFKENESTVISATLSEGIGTKPRVPDEGKVITEEKVLLEWGDEDDDDDDDVNTDDKDGNDDDKGDDQDADDEDRKKLNMKDAKGEESDKCNEEVTDATKEKAEKTSEVKDDAKKIEIPLSSSSLSGFGDQFLKLSFDSSLASTVKDSVDIDVSSLLDGAYRPMSINTQLLSARYLLHSFYDMSVFLYVIISRAMKQNFN